jgi:hypothetical protein
MYLGDQFLMSTTEFLPARDFASGDGLGITIDDVIFRQTVRAWPTNHPACLEVIQKDLTKQGTERLSIIGFCKHTVCLFSPGELRRPGAGSHGFAIARQHGASHIPRCGGCKPRRFESRIVRIDRGECTRNVGFRQVGTHGQKKQQSIVFKHASRQRRNISKSLGPGHARDHRRSPFKQIGIIRKVATFEASQAKCPFLSRTRQTI